MAKGDHNAVTVDDVTSVSTTEKKISSETNPGSDGIACPADQVLNLSCSVGAHANDDITVTVYGRLVTAGGWFEIKSFTIEAGDTDEHEIAQLFGLPYVDIGYVAAGSTDTPTVSTVATLAEVT